MVSEIRLQIWRDELKAMSDEELRLLAVSGRARDRKLELVKLEIHERDRAAAGLDRSEELSIARDANRLAEIANEKANTANTIATVAAIIATMAMAISIVVAFLQAR